MRHYKDFLSLLDVKKIDAHLRYFCGYEKLTGEADALKTVDYIERFLKEHDIPVTVSRFPAYLSNPGTSTLCVDGVSVPARPRSFSADCEGLTAELIYDPFTAERDADLVEHEHFLHQTKDKIVLGYGFDERYAKDLELHGAAGWIQIWKSDEDEIHEDTVSPIWGTPDMDSMFLKLHMPVTGIRLRDGRKLIEMIAAAEAQGSSVTAELSVHNETVVREVELPVAEIPGKRDEFLLFAGHYDTWYIGAYDNCAANAAMLEIADALNARREDLEYGVRIAWWPGHSNGRYMGSTRYMDEHYRELKKSCIACVNSDMIGAIETDILAVRTTNAEGTAFIDEVVEVSVPGTEVVYGTIGRGADQSFFGADVPYHINPRFEAKHKKFTSPGSGGDFWHTKYDLYDKIDQEILKKDSDFLGALVYGLAAEERLPLDVKHYFKIWTDRLNSVIESRGERAELLEIRGLLTKLCEKTEALCEETASRTRAIKRIIGTCNRLFQSTGSEYEHDTAFAYGPWHLLAESCRAKTRPDGRLPEAIELFYETTYRRQCNRILSELEALLDD